MSISRGMQQAENVLYLTAKHATKVHLAKWRQVAKDRVYMKRLTSCSFLQWPENTFSRQEATIPPRALEHYAFRNANMDSIRVGEQTPSQTLGEIATWRIIGIVQVAGNCHR